MTRLSTALLALALTGCGGSQAERMVKNMEHDEYVRMRSTMSAYGSFHRFNSGHVMVVVEQGVHRYPDGSVSSDVERSDTTLADGDTLWIAIPKYGHAIVGARR